MAANGAPGGDGTAGRDGLAIFTISYAGDLPLCRALCASIDRLMPKVTHYLAVDRADRALFAELAAPNRVFLATEDFAPELRPVSLGRRRLWLNPFGPPVRGWIFQQFVKLAAVARLPHEAVTIIDSDAVFVRPLERARLIRDGRVRLYRIPGGGRSPEHVRWHAVARAMLGLPGEGYTGADYISTAVTWRPEVVRALIARMNRVGWLPWRTALSWRLRFSEYVLYGVFAEHVAGPHRDLVFHDATDICHCSWHYDIGVESDRHAFVAGLRPDHAAVLIQSNLRLPQEARERLMRGLLAASGAREGSA